MLFTLWGFHFHCFYLARTFVGSWVFTSNFPWKPSTIPKTGLHGATESCAGVRSTGSRSGISKGFCLSYVCWGSVSISWSTVQCYLKSSRCLPLQDRVLRLTFIQRSSSACVQSVARGMVPLRSYKDRLLPVPFSRCGGRCRDSNQGAADMPEGHCCNIFVSVPDRNNKK